MAGDPDAPAVAPAATVEQCVRAHAARWPDRAAVVAPDGELTWAQLDREADLLAGGLLARGIRAGQRVGWLGRNRAAYVVLSVAARRAGLTIVGLNWRLSADELAYIVQDADPHLVVADGDLCRLLPPGQAVLASERGEHGLEALQDVAAGAPPDGGLPAAPEHPLFLYYTSGTTGRPKGVLYSRESVERMLRHPQPLEFQADSTLLIVPPVFHIAGGIWTQYAMVFGLKQVLLPLATPPAMLDALERWRVTHALWVPTLVQMALDEQRRAPRDLRSLRMICYGAAPMTPQLLREAARVFRCRFTQAYGMTESVGPACHLPPDAHELEGPLTDAAPATGFPDPGVQLRIVRPADGRPLGAGEVGEILLHMPRPNPTYWSRPEGARSSFDAEGWLHTGDAGFLDARGCLHLTDRLSDMIITGGENVYPAEVEAVLARIPQVADAAAFGMPDAHWGQSVWAAVIPRPGVELDGASVIEYCRAHLAHYKCPRKVVVVAELPRNVTGKVMRRELRARLAGSG